MLKILFPMHCYHWSSILIQEYKTHTTVYHWFCFRLYSVLDDTFEALRNFFCHWNLYYTNGLIVGNHILIQKHITKLRITEVKICLAVIINKYRRVNIIPVIFIYQRIAEITMVEKHERSFPTQ